MKTIETLFHIKTLLLLAGLAQIALAIISPIIPKLLNWKIELNKVSPLIKQMFWTYAGYILVINLCFGLLSFVAADDLLNGSRLALCVTGFIAVYWISRVLIQFFYFDRTNFPTGTWHKLGEVVLVSLFIFLGSIYTYVFYINFIHN